MTTETTNLKLTVYDRENDSSEKFIDFRDKLAGSNNSNMHKVDNFAKKTNDSINKINSDITTVNAQIKTINSSVTSLGTDLNNTKTNVTSIQEKMHGQIFYNSFAQIGRAYTETTPLGEVFASMADHSVLTVEITTTQTQYENLTGVLTLKRVSENLGSGSLMAGGNLYSLQITKNSNGGGGIA